jgi:hypothetical protein
LNKQLAGIRSGGGSGREGNVAGAQGPAIVDDDAAGLDVGVASVCVGVGEGEGSRAEFVEARGS